ncbi:MAG: methionyl-tRNA formyltransferase [Nitrospirales bacterium]
MRVVYMGTPDFAVPSLGALLRSSHEVVGVVTQPDRPKGRRNTLTPPPVKLVCRRAGLPCVQPTKMKDPAFLDQLKAWKPDLIAVAAFGRILPPVILSLPPKGCVNVHGSLLPKYRGAAPIQWAIINGERETGITTMLMDEGMDTGAILLQAPVPIAPDDTAGSLSPTLAEVGARLLIDTLAGLEAGRLTPRKQDDGLATMAPLLKKEDGLIDWSLSASAIANRVRGLSPWPGAYTFAGEDRWTITHAVAAEGTSALSTASPGLLPGTVPGTVVDATKQGLFVATGQGVVAIQELQPASGKCMTAAQYLAGHRLAPGLRLGPGRQRDQPQS